MENWLLYVFIGLILGMIITLIWSELERSNKSYLISNRNNFLQQQRDIITKELQFKTPEKSKMMLLR